MEKSFFREKLIQELVINEYELILATDVIEATQLTRKNSFESIIAQFSLQGSDAIELILNVKDFKKKTPIIIIDFKKSNMKHEALKAGATSFFDFPVNIKTIIELLNKSLECVAI